MSRSLFLVSHVAYSAYRHYLDEHFFLKCICYYADVSSQSSVQESYNMDELNVAGWILAMIALEGVCAPHAYRVKDL